MSGRTWVKDGKYYLADGDTTILISNILFKVHRHILTRDGSTFETMFSARDGSGLKDEGECDETPIQLFEDDVDQFRDLLWSLYALPQEIANIISMKRDMEKLANVACVAHKYNFITTEAWALQVLLTCLHTKTYTSIQNRVLIRITEAAILTGDEQILALIRRMWKGSIMEGNDLGATISAMERLGIHDLSGLAYHALLLKGREHWEQESSLNREQRIRLLSGYHNLTQVCDAFADTPPAIQHLASCPDNEECNEMWDELWRLINSLDPAYGIGMQALKHHKLDILGRSRMAVSVMNAVVSGNFPGSGEYGRTRDLVQEFICSQSALDATLAFNGNLQTGMLDFFPDVL